MGVTLQLDPLPGRRGKSTHRFRPNWMGQAYEELHETLCFGFDDLRHRKGTSFLSSNQTKPFSREAENFAVLTRSKLVKPANDIISHV